MRSSSFSPSESNKHSSTFVAFAENSEKFTPLPSHVAPRGCGKPSRSRNLLSVTHRLLLDNAGHNAPPTSRVPVTPLSLFAPCGGGRHRGSDGRDVFREHRRQEVFVAGLHASIHGRSRNTSRPSGPCATSSTDTKN